MINQTELIHEVLTLLSTTVYHPDCIDPLEYFWYAIQPINNIEEGVFITHGDNMWMGLKEAYETDDHK